jgi:hypothetical protein
MRRLNPSWAALALASVALFASLGGAAWAAGQISGSQIKNRSITSRKIGRRQVKTANLAAGAVIASKVAHGSLTAADVAPNTFLAAHGTAANSNQLGGVSASGYLAANGTAANSDQLGGVPASGYLAVNGTAANSNQLGGMPASGFVHGGGFMLQHKIDITVGSSNQLLVDVGLGEVDGSCLAGAKPQVSFTAEAQPLNLTESGTTFPSTADVHAANDMSIGTSYTEPDSSSLQALEFQVAQGDASINPSRVATVWTTGEGVGGTDCIFTAQALTTGV